MCLDYKNTFMFSQLLPPIDLSTTKLVYIYLEKNVLFMNCCKQVSKKICIVEQTLDNPPTPIAHLVHTGELTCLLKVERFNISNVHFNISVSLKFCSWAVYYIDKYISRTTDSPLLRPWESSTFLNHYCNYRVQHKPLLA